MLKCAALNLGHFRGSNFCTILEGRALTPKTSALSSVMPNTHTVTSPDSTTPAFTPRIRLKNLRVSGSDKVSQVTMLLCDLGISFSVKSCRRSPGMYVVNPSQSLMNRHAARILEILD
jgi:hypothetical protein